MQNEKIKVLLVDDSVFFREVLAKYLNKTTSVTVVDKAANVFEAETKLKKIQVDMVLMGVEKQEIIGLEFVKKLMQTNPVPIVIMSANSDDTFTALQNGAVDFIDKPLLKNSQQMNEFTEKIENIIKTASKATVKKIADVPEKKSVVGAISSSKTENSKVIAIGASTGGTVALFDILTNLPEKCPPILVVQHMYPEFTNKFAQRLDKHCKFKVVEATDGLRLHDSLCVIGAGNFHLRLEKDAQGYYITSRKGEKVSGHCPSVDVMFLSVAKAAGENAVGVILTGMGSDGAKGLLKMRDAGAYTIGESEKSCVVYGMPKVANQIGAVCEECELELIAQKIYSGF